jgi:hypothetical protein
MNFKKFRDIGDSEPRAWIASVGTKFTAEEDDEDELPVPYCDEEVEEESEDEELVEENETETETDSVSSVSTNPLKRCFRRSTPTTVSIVLQEELDFREE